MYVCMYVCAACFSFGFFKIALRFITCGSGRNLGSLDWYYFLDERLTSENDNLKGSIEGMKSLGSRNNDLLTSLISLLVAMLPLFFDLCPDRPRLQIFTSGLRVGVFGFLFLRPMFGGDDDKKYDR